MCWGVCRLLEMYANEKIGWRRRTGTNDRGTTSFDPPRTDPPALIGAQVNMSRRLIRNAKGEKMVSEGYVLTSETVNEGDMIIIGGREWPVLAVPPQKGLLGDVIYREARF